MNYELERLTNKISGRFICYADGVRYEFAGFKDFEAIGLGDKYALDSINAENGDVSLYLKPYIPPNAIESTNSDGFFEKI